ncbi:MAG: Glu-tRNA(Gln) amidotransferase subunit GatE [Nanoarchaeota archaeon]|nr:Glu-tRNA(Gln) amidotransferase subunit GatE [Nanoarchaeota archaeon]
MELDYKKLGFKCGIEIHQQVETHKLFCSCPSIVHDQNPDIKIERRLRAVAGETGKIDAAAQFELKKNKMFIYEACSTSSCLVELDEEPPKDVNMDALETALQVALLLKAKPVDEIRVMRKIVIDGSNTSGFQRTMLIATDGYIETSKGIVIIDSVCLEEESAKKIEEKEDYVRYRLDRLGIPLIEIATDASIKDSEQCKEVAGILGMILRSTNKVKRGIGTIRQDVNVSINGHPRVEIKGFQELKSIPKVIEFEIKRELSEIKSKKKLESHVRKADPDHTTSYLRPMPGAARMYPETDVPPISLTSELIKKIKIPELLTEKAIKLEKKYNLPSQLAQEIINNEDFETFVKKYKISPNLIAKTLIEIPKEISSRFKLDTNKIHRKHYDLVFDALTKNKIDESAILEILTQAARGNEINLNKYKKIETSEIESEIVKLVKSNKNLSLNALMGMVMSKYRGKLDGKKAMEIIRKNID